MLGGARHRSGIGALPSAPSSHSMNRHFALIGGAHRRKLDDHINVHGIPNMRACRLEPRKADLDRPIVSPIAKYLDEVEPAFARGSRPAWRLIRAIPGDGDQGPRSRQEPEAVPRQPWRVPCPRSHPAIDAECPTPTGFTDEKPADERGGDPDDQGQDRPPHPTDSHAFRRIGIRSISTSWPLALPYGVISDGRSGVEKSKATSSASIRSSASRMNCELKPISSSSLP